MNLPDRSLMDEYWRTKFIEAITSESDFFKCTAVPDTRNWWRKRWDYLHAVTVGRFRAWLHRDCGDW
jgi:hypothetical protein